MPSNTLPTATIDPNERFQEVRCLALGLMWGLVLHLFSPFLLTLCLTPQETICSPLVALGSAGAVYVSGKLGTLTLRWFRAL